MSITIKSISVSIDGQCSNGFDLNLGGTVYRLDHFVLKQELLSSNQLSFSMHKGPQEDIDEILFSACSQIIGKEITLSLQTENMETVSLNSESDSVSDIDFRGVIVSASGKRSSSQYMVDVQALSWDAVLEDNPSCKSYENMTLDSIVKDVIDDYSSLLDAEVEPRYTEPIPYCVQYNETHFQFLKRLARRYGEWLYNDGTHWVFGNVKKQDSVRLFYPSKDIPSYHVELKIQHAAFGHVASSYNAFDASQKSGIGEMQEPSSTLGEQAFGASQSCFTKPTLQNLHSGGYADTDSRDAILSVSAKTQGSYEKAGMLIYSGKTFSSKLKLGAKLTIIDNVISDSSSSAKSNVEQEEILITGLVHNFSADEIYSNLFTGIAGSCEYPPYPKGEVYPSAPSCRAKVTDNEDPQNLGRIRVQFDWQAQLDKDMMTPWLRITQPYAGGGKGFSFIPEKDEEVMVDFEGGNAERPYVKGMLFNGPGNPDGAWVPNGNKDNQIKAIRTRNGHTIEIHDEGENGYIRIYDNGKENYILTFSTDQKLIKLESTGNIELHAKNDIIMHAGHDITATADDDMSLVAHHDQQRTADNDIRENAGNDRNTQIGRNDSLAVSANQFIAIHDNKDESVSHNLQLSAENIRVEANDRLLEYSTTHNIKANDSIALNANTRIDVKAEIVKVN